MTAVAPIAAILFDRDGTLVRDVPYNGDPSLVEPMPDAREAVGAARAAGVLIGVVSNQSGVGRGLISVVEVAAVNARVEELLGPFDVWCVCPHAPEDGCPCRKPRPGLVLEACARLGAPPQRTVVIGDIGADVAAAQAAGAHAILVPTAATRPAEIRSAAMVAHDLVTAVDVALATGGVGERVAR